MAVHKIQVQPLTQEAFAKYGTVVDWPKNPEDYYAFHTDRFDFIPKLGTLNSDSGNMAVGIATHFLRPYRMGNMERHYHTEELMVPFEHPIILAFAMNEGLDPKEEPDYTKVEAFLVNLNQGVVVNTGVWHWTPFSVGGNARVLCIFADKTGDDDCDIREFANGEMLELCLPEQN